MKLRKNIAAIAALILALLMLAGCGGAGDTQMPDDQTPDAPPSDNQSPETSGEYLVSLTGDVAGGECEIDVETLAAKPENTFSGRYSVINNWPTKKFSSASGVLLTAVLEEAGALESFQQITVSSSDGYCISFTREQVLAQRCCFPGLQEDSAENAADAPMILALSYTDEGGDAQPEPVKTTLVFGQEDIFEHNSPAFVEDVTEIAVSSEDPGQWDMADAFPAAGEIAAGELVKLQHTYSGLVKMYYTTDGSEPTTASAMYNPSTYQPELNVPITVTEDTVIKVLVRGYGRRDSNIAELGFAVAG